MRHCIRNCVLALKISGDGGLEPEYRSRLRKACFKGQIRFAARGADRRKNPLFPNMLEILLYVSSIRVPSTKKGHGFLIDVEIQEKE